MCRLNGAEDTYLPITIPGGIFPKDPAPFYGHFLKITPVFWVLAAA